MATDYLRAKVESAYADVQTVEGLEGKPDGKVGDDAYPVAAADVDNPPEAMHSPDFRSVQWYGVTYSFTANQAAVVKSLWEAWKQETPEVGDKYLLEAADCNSDRLDLVFRNCPAWNVMIVTGNTKGTRRLAEPRP